MKKYKVITNAHSAIVVEAESFAPTDTSDLAFLKGNEIVAWFNHAQVVAVVGI